MDTSAVTQPEFSFPPNEDFDNEWNASLAYIQSLENKDSLPDLFRYKEYLGKYFYRVAELGPRFSVNSQRINELSAIAVRACNSL